jgi:hypothetical protein
MKKVRIFISYSHEDAKWINEDDKSSLLSFWKKNFSEGADFWYDKAPHDGIIAEDWKKRILQEIEKAELPAILKRHQEGKMEVVPVLVEPVMKDTLSRVDSIQITPGGPKPLSDFVREGSYKKARNEVTESLQIALSRKKPNFVINPEISDMDVTGNDFIPDQNILTTIRIPEPEYTPPIKRVQHSLFLKSKAKRKWLRYCSLYRNAGVRWGDVDYYLIAAYLVQAIKNDRQEECNITYRGEIHQYLSRMIISSDVGIQTKIIDNLKQWLGDRKSGYETSRDFAAFELGMCRARDALPLLLDRVTDPRELARVRQYAALAIGMIGDCGPDVTARLKDLRKTEQSGEMRKILDNVIYFLSA